MLFDVALLLPLHCKGLTQFICVALIQVKFLFRRYHDNMLRETCDVTVYYNATYALRLVLVTTNDDSEAKLAPRPIAGCCHLANLLA